MTRSLLVLVALGFLALAPVARGQSLAGELTDVLAEGPLDVTVLRTPPGGREVTEKGVLFRLTKDLLVYYTERGSLVTVQPRKTDTTRIEDAKHKLIWTVDPGTGKYTGNTLARIPIDIASVTPAGGEPRYLYFYLADLQERLDGAIQLENEAAIKAARASAADLATHISRHGLDRDLLRLYQGVDTYAKAQEDLTRRRKKLFRDAYEQAEKIKRDEAAARANVTAGAIAGLFGMVMSAPTSDQYTVSGNTVTYRPGSDGDPAGMMAAWSTIAQSQMSYASRQAQLGLEKESLTQQVASDLQAMDREYLQARRKRTDEIGSVGERRFQLPPTDVLKEQEQLAEVLQKNKDFTTLIVQQTQKARAARGSAPNDHPFHVVEICRLKAAVPLADPKKRAGEMFARATDCVAAVKLVPAGDAYNGHRREILATAAGLAMQAATLEIGTGSSATAYNFKALYALNILDRIAGLGIPDLGGELRSLKALALLQTGRKEDALQQGVEVEAMLKDSPAFQYNLARLYLANGNVKEGQRCLEQALKAGYNDIKSVRAASDLAALRSVKSVQNLLAVKAESKVIFPTSTFFRGTPNQKGNNVEVVNRSAFTLTNVKLQLNVTVNNKTTAYNATLDVSIPPGGTYMWKDVFSAEPRQKPQGSLQIKCDQGSVTVLPTANAR